MNDSAHDNERSGDVGAELRATREACGLELKDVAERTRIPARHLDAIERSDYAGLPAATYSTGFVRTYARLLGLDAALLSQRFRDELSRREPAKPHRQEAYEPADPARVPGRGLAWGVLALAAVLVLGYLYWRGTSIGEPAQVALATDATEPATVPPRAAAAPAPSQPSGGATTVLTAEQPAWLRITDGEAQLFQGVLEPGKSFEVPASAADPRLRTSRVTALRVTVGGTAISPLGPAETLVKNISLRPADLLARPRAATPVATPPAVAG